jgi:DNA-binding transcriptional ArsR family regulator
MAETRRKKQAARLHGRVEEISQILKLLGNPQRLLIASLLCEGEYAVSEIEEKLGIRQPTLSQQLGALREAGVIEGRREAKAVIYHLADERTRHLLDALHRIFSPEGLAAPAAPTSPPRRRALRPSLASPRKAPGDGGGCHGRYKRFESISLPSVPQQIRSR